MMGYIGSWRAGPGVGNGRGGARDRVPGQGEPVVSRLLALLTVGLICAASSAAEPLVLVKDGASPFSVYVAPGAPASVKLAAKELREYVKKVTGASLPLAAEFTGKNTISLGFHDRLKDCGLSLDGVALEGFRMSVRQGNLFIFGPDTADGAQTPQGGFSRGTLNGVYTFIEDQLGVRWLLPGEEGESAPAKATATAPASDVTQAPAFLNRRVPYIQNDRPEVEQWSLRQKLGLSLLLSHGHNWQRVVTRDDFAAHPEWFAEIGGRRVRPLADRYKVCSSNPAVVEAFARAAMAWFEKNPGAGTFSLSPTDSGGWCECKACRALDETGPDGQPRITRRILTFYNQVAEMTAKRFPDRLLCGYVYAAYQLPPLDKSFKVRPNVFLVWAPHFNYGMVHFRPDIQKLWHETLKEWASVTPSLAYYDLFNVLSQSLGAPNPPCRKILKSIMPALKDARVQGVYVYGSPAWGHAAALNYALAKLSWNPNLDVDALCAEFYDRCYGQGGHAMRTLYETLEDLLEKNYAADTSLGYHLSPGTLRDVYAATMPRMEALYAEAASKVRPGGEQARLAMFGDNMIQLRASLQSLGMLKEDKNSPFHMDAKEYAAFLLARRNSLTMKAPAQSTDGAGVAQALAAAAVCRPLEGSAPAAEPVKPFRLRGSQHIVVRAAGDEDVVFGVAVAGKPRPVQYAVYNSAGTRAAEGTIPGKGEIRFFAQGGGAYHVMLSGDIYQVTLPAAPCAFDGRAGRGQRPAGFHFQGAVTPIYFHVPKGAESFSLAMSSDAPGETAAATLYNPKGAVAATFRTVETPVDGKKVAASGMDGAVWKLVIEKADKGVLDDVHISLEDGLSGFCSLDPKQVLVVEPAR